ncbi:hypothetical protein TREMEDRAFT_20727, partial [Tremella mesenterica DSM 1558]|uniref:uncharacterized protein n=1 Tax=Tremella mesenterica (strain ATCC 24925 / CBS 8224 / DSM 1558 / NBRC 9311 / NRRL Y-6157 / RJB 2259-6 / UBC 559-6) TaxID=578456 RepID=UPI0003F4A63D
SGSISRRRVGSVSAGSLQPLDTASIRMPSNQPNALALKTASLSTSRTLYQQCSYLRKRLRCVEGFKPYLEQPPHAEHLDVVTQMCHTLRMGSPLVHIYNLLIPAFSDPSSALYADYPAPPPIPVTFPDFYSTPDGVKNWAKKPENAKQCQKYIAVFCMALKQRREEGRWHREMWALHELYGKTANADGQDTEGFDSTGLMKVLETVEDMVDNLPASAIIPGSPQTPYTASSGLGNMSGSMRLSASARQSSDFPFPMGGTGTGSNTISNMAATMNGGVHIAADSSPTAENMQRGMSRSSADANAFKSVEELVQSEKSYVQDIEILVRCQMEMVQAQLISPDTAHLMFSNISKILDFHRKFLIKLETEYAPIEEKQDQSAWAEGRWGMPFVTSETEFDCYGPYCANYLRAITLVNDQMPNLMRGETLPESQRPCLHPERELQAFMIKPIQRITKYGLLLDAVLKSTAKHEYPYRSELEDGAAAVRRIAGGINDITDHVAKQATVAELIERVEDWKGHEYDKFGDLYLDDHFSVMKAEQPREYHVFLFERMLLCCKEVAPDRKEKKSSKNASMLRKDKTASKVGMSSKRPYNLKGRIFVSNIKHVSLEPPLSSDPNSGWRVAISWTVPARSQNAGYYENVEDSFVMSGKSEEYMRKWADKIWEFAKIERKRAEEIKSERLSLQSRNSGQRYLQSSFAPPTPASEQPPYSFNMPTSSYPDDDESTTGFRSGRSTPSLNAGSGYLPPVPSRRVQSQQAMPADRQADLRARAMTEDQFGPSMSQWRNQQAPMMPPPLPRMGSNMSAMSTASEASFGERLPRGMRQASASRLGQLGIADEEEEEEGNDIIPNSNYSYNSHPPTAGPPFSARGMMMSRAPSHNSSIPTSSAIHPPPLRSRSASSPQVYQIRPKPQPPLPVPNSGQDWQETMEELPNPGLGGGMLGTSSSSTLVGGTVYFTKRMSGGKRSSGDSQSTEASTASSQSPATPYGVQEGMVRGGTPVSRQPSGDGLVVVTIHCGSEKLQIHITRDVSYSDLVSKVLKKCQLCA